MRTLLLGCCLICSGCTIALSTSGFKCGLTDSQVVTDNAGNTVYVEDVTGISVSWLPFFTYHDLVWWKN